MALTCPGFKGTGWFGLWGDCRYVRRIGFGWLSAEGSTEHLCQHPSLVIKNEAPFVGTCPTKGKKS